MPVGPDNPEGYLPGTANGWTVCAGAKNPDGALMYLIGRAEYAEMTKDTSTGTYALLTDEQRARAELYTTSDKSGLIYTSGLQGIGNIANLQWAWWDEVRNGTPIATANETHAPIFQAEIDMTLADVLPKVKQEFAGLPVIDFEGETASYMLETTPEDTKWGNLSFEVVEDGIDGKSLKIVRDPSHTIPLLNHIQMIKEVV